MDYEKKYKDALERARELVEKWIGKNKNFYIEDYSYIFPELKESEDEKVRKEIIDYCHERLNTTYGALPNIETIKRWLAWLEKQGERKPADKVEPKFKVKKGEWYVCTETFVLRGKIIAIKGQTYQSLQDDTITCEDNCLFIDRHDGKASSYFRLWTIKDAKDGDVLASENGCAFIYQKTNGVSTHFYCCVSLDNDFLIDNHRSHCGEKKSTKPATKEQRDLLFQKMKEAGYEWDAEKKELKKIEQKPAWSEEDEKIMKRIDSLLYSQCTIHGSVYEELHKWLESLKERMKGE